MRADCHQQAVNQVHRLRLEALAVVLAAIAGRHDRDTGVHDLGELRLRLQRLGAAQAIQTLNDKHRAGRHLAVLDRAEEYAQRALPHMALVVCRQPFVPE